MKQKYICNRCHGFKCKITVDDIYKVPEYCPMGWETEGTAKWKRKRKNVRVVKQ